MFTLSLLLSMLVAQLMTSQVIKQQKSAAFIVVTNPIPEPHTLDIEITTIANNRYRVTVVVQGKTGASIRDAITKELLRHHWDVAADKRELVRINGYKLSDGEIEEIKSITLVMYANHPRDNPSVPGVNFIGSVRVKILLQLVPAPNVPD